MRIIHALLALATFSLPFSYAMTLNVGFPLKIYEICLLLAVPLFFLLGQGGYCLKHWRLLGLFLFFVLATLITLLFRVEHPGEGYAPETSVNRFGPFTDSALKIGYAALNFVGFFLYAWYAEREPGKFLKYWILGAVVSALYSIHCAVFSTYHLPVLHLPGIDVIQYYNDVTIRNGTFMEGNYSGLFYLVSAILAIKHRSYWSAGILAAGVLSSVSTTSIFMMLATVVVILGYELRHIRFVTSLTILLMVLFVCGIGVVLVGQTNFGQGMVMKVTTDESATTEADIGYSRDNRMDTAMTALRIFKNHFLLGVGIAQYGNYYLNTTHTEFRVWDPQRVIPNNVYTEILSETGVLGSIPFFLSVALVFMSIWRSRDFYFILAMVEIFIGWNAFPTFSIMYLWAFFGGTVGYLGSSRVPAAAGKLAVSGSEVAMSMASRPNRDAYLQRRRSRKSSIPFALPTFRVTRVMVILTVVALLLAAGGYIYLNQPPARLAPPPGFILGMNGKSPEQEIYGFISPEEQMQLLKEMGVSWYRVSWSDRSTPEQIDRILDAAEAAGIKILPVLTPEVDLSADRPPADYEAEAEQFAKKWVGRYAGRLTTWELGNELDDPAMLRRGDTNPANGQVWDTGEPDGSEVFHYEAQRLERALAVLRGLSRGVEEAQPSARRLIGTAGWKHYGFLQAVEEAQIPYEIIAWHWYSEMGAMTHAGGTNVLERLRSFHRDIWITEAGRREGSIFHSEKAQADYYAEDIRRMAAYYPEVKAYFVYELLDEPALGLMNGESYYGVLTVEPDDTGTWKVTGKKPAFQVIQSQAKWLSGR